MARHSRSAESIGAILRQERLRQGLDLPEVAGRTRISERFLAALEEDDYAALPGGFFAKSFIRQYSTLLGIYDDELEQRVRDLIPVEMSLPVAPADSPVDARELPPIVSMSTSPPRNLLSPFSVAMFVLVLVGCSALYVLWERHRQPESVTVATTKLAQAPMSTVQQPPASEAPRQEPPAAVAQPAAAATENQSVTPVPKPTAAVGAKASTQQPGAGPVTPVPATTPPPPSPAPSAGASSDSPVVVGISAKENVWIRVTADGKTVFVGVLAAGESRTFQSNLRTVLAVGNAGGLEVRWNGTDVGSIGSRGEVRTLEFTPTAFGPVFTLPKIPAATPSGGKPDAKPPAKAEPANTI